MPDLRVMLYESKLHRLIKEANELGGDAKYEDCMDMTYEEAIYQMEQYIKLLESLIAAKS